MIKIYGSPRSSAGRCFLLLEEAGVPYTVMPVDLMEKREQKSSDFLRLNPNGKVPCLVDGDFVLWESLAINSYIAEKYKPELLGQGPQARALIEQWSLWAIGELQAPLIDILIQTHFMPAEKRDAGLIQRSQDKIPPLLKILDQAVAGRAFLLGDSLTLADLNVASAVNVGANLGYKFEEYAHLLSWFEKVRARPSFQKYISMRASGKAH